MANPSRIIEPGSDVTPGSPGAQIQDPATGQWVPYPANDNGTGNIMIDGVVYSHDQGALAYQQQQGTSVNDKIGGPVVAPPPNVNTYPEDPGYGVNPVAPPAAAPPPPAAAPPPATGGGGGLIDPYPGGPYVPPDYKPPPAFVKPTFDEAANDPGFQFVQREGQEALERSAAARGVLNSGGTLKDIANWNQGLAATQYSNVWDRNLAAYNTNYTTQYLDPYKNAYQSALQKYQTNYQAWLDRINESKDITNM
jgi:hypothetical protein